MGFLSSSKPDLPGLIPPTFDEGAVVHATFKTSEGDFKAKLHAAECPITVGNFLLASQPVRSHGPTSKYR